ncbi:MAG: VWA domain-containing protein [Candidatus Aminicenantes bacterium]|nr:VWA domain-containing protein [Candidatus Aminicenantes bacterium]NIM82520.1 VWA domain-containing protein [Candidatus Aminicenantes bacterium]NIN21878.1 VWA domain-containing protein [Candidatus Aminicenantes bacterium]NIN45656.1 VWA domain-containing protein [Candidatus Aminicenantes bacterium]NIN88489.1 VWA domain-containing protein [Candidatus Aminicenantes bacterium]
MINKNKKMQKYSQDGIVYVERSLQKDENTSLPFIRLPGNLLKQFGISEYEFVLLKKGMLRLPVQIRKTIEEDEGKCVVRLSPRVKEAFKSVVNDPLHIVPPECIVLVVDTSGSMEEENKLVYAKEAIISLVTNETKSVTMNHIGVVEFSSSAYMISPITREFQEIPEKIKNLIADGSTEMYLGMGKARDMLKDKTNMKRIILLSDGQPQKPDLAIREAEQCKKKGVIIDTIGFGEGENIDIDLLKKIAAMTGGKFFHVREIRKLSSVMLPLVDDKKYLPAFTQDQ